MLTRQDRSLEQPNDAPASQCAILVIGLGNPLRGDDGVGVRVVQALATRALPLNVEVVDAGTHGLGIVNLLEGRQQAIFVDAAEIGKAPGQFTRFALDTARLVGEDQHLSVHAAGLRDALLLAQALDMLPEKVVVFGVQPAKIEWDRALSPDVEATLPAVVSAVLAELETSHQLLANSNRNAPMVRNPPLPRAVG